LSVHGIYRLPETPPEAFAPLSRQASPSHGPVMTAGDALLHHRYRLPARCFAYVADPTRPLTWHLPYRLADGSVDHARLPKAIQAILSNYRGAQVGVVPEAAIPDVLDRLQAAARELGKMPDQAGPLAAPVYRELAKALEQFGRLG
jgi:hypothetical protein